MFIDSGYLQYGDGALDDKDNKDVQVKRSKIINIGYQHP
jgi:hypothetical protein